MKILLFGGSGQVGWELQRALSLLGGVTVARVDGGQTLAADFSRPETLAAVVAQVRPDVIVNAAAHTAVDRCESEPELARAINASAPAVLAKAAKEAGAWLVHYSTDYVFDGSGHVPWREGDATGPLSVYGATKLEGEQAIRASGCRHFIVRTSWVHSARGGNFARTMLRLAAEREALAVIDDQFGAPTSAELLADATAHMLRRIGQAPELAGTYHVAAAGVCTWHEYACYVIDFARARSHSVRVSPDAIAAVPTSHYPTPARRPANSRLDTSKWRAAFDLSLPDWQAGVARTLTEMLEPQ